MIAYPPATGHGKYHEPNAITGTARCGAPVLLDLDNFKAIHVRPDATGRAHPIVCKRCLRRLPHANISR